ncbi:unnamed protein product [Prorocentrum cordatum]|uniref:Photolyase/cryptochrome alpha/beta domain-containing protein n=1 Tax=Prorocentrum cordatum TaxID=2364126 RepID=A0ABN9PIG1_9DINO|nr:unnamed protein product [Polarella glacialis]
MLGGTLLWLRNDLRILDQPLVDAVATGERAWIYVFDTRFLSRAVPLPGGVGSVPKASARRARFLLQSVRDLSGRLRRELGAELLVRVGPPEEALCEAAGQLGWAAWDVCCQRDWAPRRRGCSAGWRPGPRRAAGRCAHPGGASSCTAPTSWRLSSGRTQALPWSTRTTSGQTARIPRQSYPSRGLVEGGLHPMAG